MMENFLPYTKFTHEVMFYDDYLYVLSDGTSNTLGRGNSFEEQLCVSKIEIYDTLDYQPYEPSRDESKKQEHVVKVPSIELTNSDPDNKIDVNL